MDGSASRQRLALSDDDAVRHDALSVLLELATSQPRARGLLAVLAQATLRDPLNIPKLVLALGPAELASWLGHFGAMLAFDAAQYGLVQAKVMKCRQKMGSLSLADPIGVAGQGWQER